MRTLIVSVCLSLLFAMMGCSKGPIKGEGGFAEHNYSNTPNHPVGMENALYFELQLSQRHLDALLAAGANICFPASVKKSSIRQARIARELQGGLSGDAANDLIIQRDQLDRLDRRLRYVKMQDSCLPTDNYKGDQPGHMLHNDELDTELANNAELTNEQVQYLIAILNNNNQFVINSSELNPRFIGQLSEATQMLRDHPQYHLKLTGHTDSVGNAASNLKLSLARAAQVERYLLIFGFNPNNISVNGSGAEVPLFDDDEPQVRLVNRRVSIELINTSPAAGKILK